MNDDHLTYFYRTFLGEKSEPHWWRHRSKVPGAIAELWTKRQAIYFADGTDEAFRNEVLMITRRWKLTKSMVYFLLGIASTNPHDPYNSVRIYLNKHDPKLTIK